MKKIDSNIIAMGTASKLIKNGGPHAPKEGGKDSFKDHVQPARVRAAK